MKQNIFDHEIFFEQYSNLRNSGVTYNDFIEQPALKSLIFTLEGKTLLDLGCGNGHFARYCVENGAAKVVGVDISKKMIEQAKMENSHDKIEYICMPIEDLHLQNQTFDIIISSLVMHYIKDYAAIIKKIGRLLHKDGRFIFSTEHPIATARIMENSWIKDSEGNKLHWALDDYQEEGVRETHWYIDGVIKYHRTISTLINTLIQNGFILEKMIEPQSIPAGIEQMPKLLNEKRRPSFLIIKSRKG